MAREYTKTKWGREIPYTSPTGVKTYLYNIGTLAEELGRTVQTIRKWEIGGVIPETPFKQNGRRLYSREHMDAIISCAERAKIRQGSSSTHQTSFTKWVYKEFQRINDLFFNVEKENSKNG